MSDNLKQAALDYHRKDPPGKITITPTKELATQRDLSLAYSPGVAAACELIVEDPAEASSMTARGNLVAVITNGTAVLGLGDIGPLASKPVMEGKAVLFKKFAGLDAMDIEIEQLDVDKLVDTIAALEPTFGGINLEDIKAPECFEVEARLRERMNIPVFHDDQHGTAIIVSAAFRNWLRWSGRDINKIRLVASGAGASAIACLTLMVNMGLPRENITVCDRKGVVYKGRSEYMDPHKAKFAVETNARTLKDAIEGADVFLGLSAPGVMTADMVATMADAPLIMALANPTPEIMPEEARKGKSDAVICTGRSDFPNQVNNVLCFPFIFRGALDVGATSINEEMKLACVEALADLTMEEASAEVAALYGGEQLKFGPEYLIPKPFDPRLIVDLSVAVAKAAMDSGVATRPIEDLDEYAKRLSDYVYKSGFVMRPVFARAKEEPKRVVYAEGEEERVLRAAQVVVDEGLAKPILIGREAVVAHRMKRLGLRLKMGVDYDLVDPEDDPRYPIYWKEYHTLMERHGVTPDMAKTFMRTNTTIIAAMMIHMGDADAMICGTLGRFPIHHREVVNILGLKEGVSTGYALSALVLPKGVVFVCDTYVNPDPTAEQVAEMVVLAAEQVSRFGITPKVALLSHSNFGSHVDDSALKMRRAAEILRNKVPELEVDGEMHADSALEPKIREVIFPNSKLTGAANLLVMPNLDAANISFNTLKILADGLPIGPLLLGLNRPAHIVTPSITARGLVNVTSLASVEAQLYDAGLIENRQRALM